MAAPLLHEEGALGVLSVLDRPEQSLFSLQEMELLGLFANQAAIAVDLLLKARAAEGSYAAGREVESWPRLAPAVERPRGRAARRGIQAARPTSRKRSEHRKRTRQRERPGSSRASRAFRRTGRVLLRADAAFGSDATLGTDSAFRSYAAVSFEVRLVGVRPLGTAPPSAPIPPSAPTPPRRRYHREPRPHPHRSGESRLTPSLLLVGQGYRLTDGTRVGNLPTASSNSASLGEMLSSSVQSKPPSSQSASAFRSVLANPSLRNLELAWSLAILGQWAFVIGVSIYAFDAGGEQAVGIVILLRFGLAAVTAPFAGLLADRNRRESVLLASAVSRVILLGAAAICVSLDTEPIVVYALAIAAAIAATPFRSAQAALTPTLARTPEELTAANAVASTVESVAVFAGPAFAGLLLAATGAAAVFAVTAGMLAMSALVLLRVHGPQTTPKGEVEASTLASEALAGFRTIGREPALRVLMTLLAAQTFLFGSLQVYMVVLSVDTLSLGDAGVGYLNSAIGIGCVIGAVLAMGLTGVRRLSVAFVTGVFLVGAPLVALGFWTETIAAFVLLGVAGLGNSLLDVAGLTLVQRAVPEEVLARVFGVIQMLFYAALGIGAILAPSLLDWLGIDGALIATGLFLVVLTAVLAPLLIRIDSAAKAPEADELNLLGRTPIFAPLPGTTLEHLAGRLLPLRLAPGEVVVREGDAGDRFYLVAEGELEVSSDRTPISTLGVGDSFGEIALLRDLPRTATVTVRSPAVLYALDRDEFLAAVTGHPASEQAAEAVVGARLSTFAPAGVKVTAA